MFIAKKKVLLPTNDYCFKRIFGNVGNEDITKDLIESILNIQIESIDLDRNTILEKDLENDKGCILDIKAKINNKSYCNIEMQVVNQHDTEKRILYYWSKLYISSIKAGGRYNLLPKTIVILIADFELDNLKEIPEYHTKWEIRESKNHKVVLTEAFELHILELPKIIYNLSKESNEKLLLWLKFIKNPNGLEESEMSKNNVVIRAKEEYDKLDMEEYEERMAISREMAMLDRMSSYSYGLEKGIEEGMQKGMQKGIKKGERQKSIKIAKALLKEGIDIEKVIKITGLSEEEINSTDE